MTTIKILCYSWLFGDYETELEIPTNFIEKYLIARETKNEELEDFWGEEIEYYIWDNLDRFYKQNISQVFYNDMLIFEY